MGCSYLFAACGSSGLVLDSMRLPSCVSSPTQTVWLSVWLLVLCFARGVPKAHSFMTNLSDCCAAFIVSFVVVAVEGIGDITVRCHSIKSVGRRSPDQLGCPDAELFSYAMQTLILSMHP